MMRILIILLIVFCSISTFAQSFQTRSTGAFTTIDNRSGALWNFYLPYNNTDTSLNGGKDTLGAILHVRSGSLQGVWFRDSVSTGGHKWVQLYSTSNITQYWQLSGSDLQPISTSYNLGIGGTPAYQFDVQNSGTGRFYFDGTRINFYDNSTYTNLIIGNLAGNSLVSNTSSNNIAFGSEALRFGSGNNNVAIGQRSLYENNGGLNTAIGYQSLYLTDSTYNTAIGYNAGVQNYGKQNTIIGALSENAAELDNEVVNNSEIITSSASISGTGIGTLISGNSLIVGEKYPIKIDFNGSLPSPYTSGIIGNATVTNSNTISIQNIAVFTTQGSGTMNIRLYNKQDNAIAIGYNATTDSSNQIVIGNSDNSILKVNQFIVDLKDVPATGEVLVWDGTKAIWDTITGGGGGGSYSFLSPLSETGGVVSIQNAAADGSTKGAATFTASDFNASSGNISLDINNIQAASTTLKGMLISADWNTFNNKVSTGAITGSGLTMATSRLLGRTTASTGAIEEISVGSGLSLSGGVLSSTGSGGTVTTVSGVAANGFTWSIANASTTPAITLTLQNATTAQSGQLTATDWNTFNGKQATITGAATTIISSNLTASRALVSNASGKVDVSIVSSAELGYVSGVTSAIQTQLNNKETAIIYAYQTLTDGATITLDGSLGINFKVTLAGNRTLALSNITSGKTYKIEVNQDATGNRHLTLPANSLVGGGGISGSGTSIILSTTGLAKDQLSFTYDGTNYLWNASLDYQ